LSEITPSTGWKAIADSEMQEKTIPATDAFINQLPDGLDYQIAEGGIGLSGGQIQSLLLSRIPIAC
jgi:ABC-type bacteriocin/lantibiotic exporter with double-glycine peptidase domain